VISFTCVAVTVADLVFVDVTELVTVADLVETLVSVVETVMSVGLVKVAVLVTVVVVVVYPPLLLPFPAKGFGSALVTVNKDVKSRQAFRSDCGVFMVAET
jgi:hypothetical protein